MAILLRWLARLGRRNPEDREDTAKSFPRKALTSTPSQEVLPGAPFFSRLSYEIRTAILVEAFGNRTIHMHLTTDEERKLDGAHDRLEHEPYKKGLRWSSSICHRTTPGNFGQRHDPGPTSDPCHWQRYDVGNRACCYGLGVNRECIIGVMGFLLACRQAYTDGIRVLYSTNTIHIEGPTLLFDMSRYILLQRLANIKSVEIVWTTPQLRKDSRPHREDLTGFLRMLGYLPGHLPGLRKAFVALSESPRFEENLSFYEIEAAVESTLLESVDRMVGELSQLRQFELALPASIYSIIKRSPLQPGWDLGSEPERIRRSLPEHRTDGVDGYWIRLSIIDMLMS